MSSYKFLDYPFISKTTYLLFKTCRHRFKRIVLDKVSTTGNQIMQDGTNLHWIFQQTLLKVDKEHILALDWETALDRQENAVYKYLYALACTFVPPNLDNRHIFINLQSWALFETTHWIDIRRQYRNRADIWKYWFPLEMESFYYDECVQLFGTVDRVFADIGGEVIGDYKTGRVPISVTRAKPADYAGATDLPPKYTIEGNFYVLLRKLSHGYKIAKVDGKWNFFKNGKIDNSKNLDYCFMFTNGLVSGIPHTYLLRKRMSMASIGTIMDTLEKIRCNEDWSRVGEIRVCQWCPLYETECKGKLPFEIFGDVFGSENTASESIPDER